MKTVRSILDNYAYRVQNYRGRSLLEETTQAIEDLCSAVDGLKKELNKDRDYTDVYNYNEALEDVKEMIRR